MGNFEFITDQESERFCKTIVEKMIDLFSISEEEALGRINRKWRGIKFVGEDHIIYHELEDFWAYDIYYGSDSRWWARKDDVDLKPLPFP
ncbi:hypothetical protein ACI7RC_10695 [Brevibacillus sp. B_LB10_24]|uniref:hypothetical protein n=1 Tax=Brevibacillus sp. B_LB10_24 TaxID=3380645 RepID=UPI0038BAE2F0